MKRPVWLLLLGSPLVMLANLRWGVGALAWLAPIPLLRYLRITSGWRTRGLFLVAMMVTWTATTMKIVTAPLPAFFAFLGIGFGLVQALGFLGANWLRAHFEGRLGVLAFPVTVAAVEFLQYRLTGLSSWSAAGYTQVDDLPLLQVASIAGVIGVGFIVNAVASAAEHAWSQRRAAPLVIAASIAVAAHAFGVLRLAHDQGDTTPVAAVNTLGTFGPASHLDAREREQIIATLLDDSASAARAGAKLVVWTEAAAFVMPDEEQPFIERVRATAAALHVHLVAGYVIPTTPRFENKLVWARPDGTVDHVYRKHHPAPGEPSVVGTDPLRVIRDGSIRYGGAICYDYDYPQLAAEHGALGVDIVALPSSDWRGIDPIHTQMAALRAIEQGVSIVRSTRFGLSAGIDPYGRLRAWSSSFDGGQRVMVVDLPRHGVDTVYRHVGDLLAWLSLASVAGAVLAIALRSR